ncbi:MAG: hypothetical protein HYX74_07680 [Acidobacteria bacterium]|nr:hypothetical protein [Acidobacteriota bacterium]
MSVYFIQCEAQCLATAASVAESLPGPTDHRTHHPDPLQASSQSSSAGDALIHCPTVVAVPSGSQLQIAKDSGVPTTIPSLTTLPNRRLAAADAKEHSPPGGRGSPQQSDRLPLRI